MDNELIYEEYDENGNIVPCVYHSGIRKCKLCEILLSKTRECHKLRHKDDHEEWITIKYGDYYDEAPDYCKECYRRFVKGNEKCKKKKKNNVGGTEPKQIKQLTFQDDVVRIWDSITEASEKLGLTRQGISNCINGYVKSYKGYKWENINNGN